MKLKLSTVQIDSSTRYLLGKVSAADMRKLNDEIRFLVSRRAVELGIIKIDVTELPHPADGSPVPLVVIQEA
jgi:hypothetical protein